MQELLWQKTSIRNIAIAIGRNPSLVARELLRNNPLEQRRYFPRLAHERALIKRKSGLVFIIKLESKNSHATISAISNRVRRLVQRQPCPRPSAFSSGSFLNLISFTFEY